MSLLVAIPLHHSQWVECHQYITQRMTLLYLEILCSHKIHQDFDQNQTIWLFDQIRCSMIHILTSIHKWTYTTCIPYALVPYNEFVWVHHIDVFLKISIKNGGLDIPIPYPPFEMCNYQWENSDRLSMATSEKVYS